MSASFRALVAAVILSSGVSLFADKTDPTGHWEGAIHIPDREVTIEVDLALNDKGALAGTFSNPARNVRGFPLTNVAIDGDSITFAINASGGGTFSATLAGKAMKGTFVTRGPDGQPLELPFDLTRTGDAKTEAVPRSSAISKQLEGTWTGTLEVEGKPREIRVRLQNHPDGTSSGFVITAEGVEIAIARIEQKESDVTLDVKNIGGTYTGSVSEDGSEIVGTWTQGEFSAPLTFRRVRSLVDRWSDAIGGRERVAAVRSIYREATIEVGGLKGSIRAWHTADGKYRKEEQIGAYDTVETFDGVKGTLPSELARSQSFANWNAVFFAFFPERHRGTTSVGGDDTIVLAPEGAIERSVILDPKTSLPRTMSHQRAGRTITVTFVEYETIDGIRFEKELHRTTGDPRFDAVIRFTKTVINPPVKEAMFARALPN